TFRTIPDRDHRAMAGLSMGGMQTYHITLSHLDLFSYIAGFSGASGPFISGRDLDVKNDYNGVLADPAAFAKKVHVLWLGVGTAEPERMRDSIRKLHAMLNRRRHRARLPGVARHGPRVADLAAESQRLRASAVSVVQRGLSRQIA